MAAILFGGAGDGPALPPREFEFFRGLIHEKAGIKLNDKKMSLVQSRLRQSLRRLGLEDYAAYRMHLQSLPAGDPEWQEFINLLTTNKTSFFRETPHYEHLRSEFVPGWLERGAARPLNVWSAASSTGQEPYSVSIWLRHLLPAGADYRILGTDIDTEVLRHAENAVYPRASLEEIPEEARAGSFGFGSAEISGWMRLRAPLRDRVRFRAHNLMSATPPEEAPFDAIFCSNVLIYFAPKEVEFVVNKLFDAAADGATLYIGRSESLINVDTKWKCVRPAIYRKG